MNRYVEWKVCKGAPMDLASTSHWRGKIAGGNLGGKEPDKSLSSLLTALSGF